MRFAAEFVRRNDQRRAPCRNIQVALECLEFRKDLNQEKKSEIMANMERVLFAFLVPPEIIEQDEE
jgi:hypothetical protein